MSPVQSVTDVPVHSLPLGAFVVAVVFQETGSTLRAGRGRCERSGGCAIAAVRKETSSQSLPVQDAPRSLFLSNTLFIKANSHRLMGGSHFYQESFHCPDRPFRQTRMTSASS
jgi:hypothetical protein